MCYDISFKTDIKQISDYFPDLKHDDPQKELEFQSQNHILGMSYKELPAIYIKQDDHNKHLGFMEWGCIPNYINTDEKYEKFKFGRQKWLNFQSERALDDTTSYWFRVKDNRCLLPATGFYEHQEVIHEEKSIKTYKTKPPEEKITKIERSIPYYIEIPEQPMFFIPALYSIAYIKNAQGFVQPRWTISLGTRSANGVMRAIHNSGDFKWRMPMMVPFELSELWLSKGLTRGDVKEIFNYRIPSEKLRYHTVRSVRARKEPTPDELKIQPFQWDKVPELVIESDELLS